ncbi:MAG: protein-methionine-sulfoxide reductase catalytic subunit MsrP [Pseudomonadota bacterium]
MQIRIKNHNQLTENSVTDEAVWADRRRILKGLGYVGAGALLGNVATNKANANTFGWFKKDDTEKFVQTPLNAQRTVDLQDEKTAESVATTYNNFYEFGTAKEDPAEYAQGFTVDPWTLTIEGLVENPIVLGYEDLYSKFPIQERIYRLRCVEAWSMVIPWLGFPLHQLISAAKPLSSAKYVAFETIYSPEQMRGQRNRFVGGGIDYPYVEGLRLDEAMHDLTLMGVGMYGKTLPPQNGAPIRLVIPWKYGFKSIKSLVKIRLTDKEPPTTWNILAAHEYGFYANVNPAVDHPRWSQRRERRILGAGLNAQERIDTLPFNGYTEVADLYANLDLTKYY